jgi:hypothetical protein
MVTDALRRDWIMLRRDAILYWRALVTAILIYTAFQAYFVARVSHPTVWMVCTSVYVSFITVIPLTIEDRFRTAAWTCTLPLTRAEIVRGRYVTSWTLVVGLFLVALALAALMPGSAVPPSALLTPDRLLIAGGVITVILLAVLPFTIRFGFMGVMLGLVTLQIAGAVFFVVAKVTGHMGGVEGAIGGAFRFLTAWISMLRERLPLPLFRVVMLAVLILVNWAGYRGAVAAFRRREL